MIGRWLCKLGKHKWEEKRYYLQDVMFHTRKCVRCGRREILQCGPMGSGEWAPEDEVGKKISYWEWKRYCEASGQLDALEADAVLESL